MENRTETENARAEMTQLSSSQIELGLGTDGGLILFTSRKIGRIVQQTCQSKVFIILFHVPPRGGGKLS